MYFLFDSMRWRFERVELLLLILRGMKNYYSIDYHILCIQKVASLYKDKSIQFEKQFDFESIT